MRLIDADALMRKFKTASPMAIDGRARQIVNDMPTIEERKWIPWSERRPEGGHNYLFCMKDGTVGEGAYHAMLGQIDIFRWNQPRKYDDVIAWQHLPEPWKGEAE